MFVLLTFVIFLNIIYISIHVFFYMIFILDFIWASNAELSGTGTNEIFKMKIFVVSKDLTGGPSLCTLVPSTGGQTLADGELCFRV